MLQLTWRTIRSLGAELPKLISSIHQTLGSLGKAPEPVAALEPPKPAVPIKKSVTDDYLISLFDGRKFKSLKRHLMTKHNVNPDEYRTMFGLPKDYPMVAPAYAKHRSGLAKSSALGPKAVAEKQNRNPRVQAASEPAGN